MLQTGNKQRNSHGLIKIIILSHCMMPSLKSEICTIGIGF